MNAKIIGTGCQLPAYAADNHYLSTLVETSDEWITERTGIRMRHLAQKETTTSLSVDGRKSACICRHAGIRYRPPDRGDDHC